MSFELKGRLWSPIEEVNKQALQPVMSTISDSRLIRQMLDTIGLAQPLSQAIGGSCRDFKEGRVVTTTSIEPYILGTDIMPPEDVMERWFNAGGHVVGLAQVRQTTCGGWADRAQATIFGPES